MNASGIVYPLYLTLPLVLGACVLLFLKRKNTTGGLRRFGDAVGWLALWAYPACIVQAVGASWVWPNHSIGASARWLSLYFPWPVHLGGWTVTSIFESTAKQVTGHRRDTLMDNLHYYLGLTLAQCVILALLLMAMNRLPLTFKRMGWIAVGAFVLVNAHLNITWPWWGT